ncbi:MAG: transposase [Bdellovibrionales bacterium]|nr:transposase [Bdellovibrionales bacterium]
MWRGHNREWNLNTPDEKRAYLNFLGEGQMRICKQFNSLHALCLMSNHVHELYTLDDLATFSNFMRQHHGRYGLFFNRKHQRQGKVAQDRPKTCAIENDYHDMIVTFYIHANPLRAKICGDAKDYLWSSHALYAFGKKASWMKGIRIQFPKWYLQLGKTWKERQANYRKAFDAYLKEHGLRKKELSALGVGSYSWILRRKQMLRTLWKQKRLAKVLGPPI